MKKKKPKIHKGLQNKVLNKAPDSFSNKEKKYFHLGYSSSMKKIPWKIVNDNVMQTLIPYEQKKILSVSLMHTRKILTWERRIIQCVRSGYNVALNEQGLPINWKF